MPSLSEETGGRVSMLMPGSTIGIITLIVCVVAAKLTMSRAPVKSTGTT